MKCKDISALPHAKGFHWTATSSLRIQPSIYHQDRSAVPEALVFHGSGETHHVSELVTEGSQSPYFYFFHRELKRNILMPNEERIAKSKILKCSEN